jgi:phospholipase/carboxylesterase
MNRLATLVEAFSTCKTSGAVQLAPLSAETVDPSVQGDAPPFSTFIPIHYEPGYAYPLVVWLHGPQGNEDQLRRIMPLVSMRNYIGVAPRGPQVDSDLDGSYDWPQSLPGIEEAEARVFACIDAACHKFHVHPERIFVGGYGSGGTMAIRIAWNAPHRFAGAMSIAGAVPGTHCPLRRVNDIRRIPLLLASGKHSHTYSEEKVCRDLRLLHSAGFKLALRQYPVGDELISNMLSDLDQWVMEIICDNFRR